MSKKLYFTFLALLIVGSLYGQSLPNYVPANGLLSWYSFNGNANDLGPFNFNGSALNTTITTDRFNNPNSAYEYNGSSSQISISGTNFGNSSFTVSGWIYMDSNQITLPNTVYKEIFSAGFSGGDKSFEIVVYKQPNNDWVIWTNMRETMSNDIIAIAPNKVNINGWTHFAVVKTISNLQVYINGKFAVSTTHNASSVMDNGNWRIGNGQATVANRFFQGKIDDIGIWTRSLTPIEIFNLYDFCTDSIATSPKDTSLNIGQNAIFITRSTSANATYQWQTDFGFGFSNISNAGQYFGANNDTLVVNNLNITNDSQKFRCIVNNGFCVDTTSEVTLTINNSTNFINFGYQNTIVVYPNPTNQNLFIKSTTDQYNTKYKIIDGIGKEVYSNVLNGFKNEIKLDGFKPGIYILIFEDKKYSSIKFSKN